MSTEVHESASVEETMAIAERLAARLSGGAVVLLEGDLGTGKTHFVKGLARGLGFDPDEVASPTFTIVDIHRAPPGGLDLVHVDLYRIGHAAELTELGLSEIPGPRAVAAIEWPERLATRLPGSLRVRLVDLGGDRRRIEIG